MKKYTKEELKKVIFQFIKFGIVGASNTLISLAIYYIFVFINKSLYLVGNTVGFIISVLNAYYWNNKYVFKDKKQEKNFIKILKVYLSYGVTFVLGTVFIWIMVDKWGVSEKLAPIINLCATIPINFILNKFFAFGEKRNERN